jgi:hypothetical protein
MEKACLARAFSCPQRLDQNPRQIAARSGRYDRQLPALQHRGDPVKYLTLVGMTVLLLGCSHYSNKSTLCEPNPLAGVECQQPKALNQIIGEKYREWRRYQ